MCGVVAKQVNCLGLVTNTNTFMCLTTTFITGVVLYLGLLWDVGTSFVSILIKQLPLRLDTCMAAVTLTVSASYWELF